MGNNNQPELEGQNALKYKRTYPTSNSVEDVYGQKKIED